MTRRLGAVAIRQTRQLSHRLLESRRPRAGTACGKCFVDPLLELEHSGSARKAWPVVESPQRTHDGFESGRPVGRAAGRRDASELLHDRDAMRHVEKDDSRRDAEV